MHANFSSTRWHAVSEAHGRCANPWCGKVGIDVHHIVHRQEGGSDKAENLILLCRSCHQAYHQGLLGRRTILLWKHALAREDAPVLGCHLSAWPRLPVEMRRRIRRQLQLGLFETMASECTGIFWNAEEPEWIVQYGFPLANLLRQQGSYALCAATLPRLEQAIQALQDQRGAAFGMALVVRLNTLKARLQRGLGEFNASLERFEETLAVGSDDEYALHREDMLRAQVDSLSIKTRINEAGVDDVAEARRLERNVVDARSKNLIRSPSVAAALMGDLAVVKAKVPCKQHNRAAVVAAMRPAIENLRSLGYARGYSLRLLNMADMLRTMIPRRSGRREDTIQEIYRCYVAASEAATVGGRVPLEHSVIGASAGQIRRAIDSVRASRMEELRLPAFH